MRTRRRPLALLVSTSLAVLGVALTGAPAHAATSTLSGTTVDGPRFVRFNGDKSTQSLVSTHFRALGFTVDTTGTYTFTQSSPTAGRTTGQYDGIAGIFQDSFVPTNPTAHIIAASDDTSASDTNPSMANVALDAGHTYVYVATGDKSTDDAGAFTVSVNGAGTLTPIADPVIYAARFQGEGPSGSDTIAIQPQEPTDPHAATASFTVYTFTDDPSGAPVGTPTTFTPNTSSSINVPGGTVVRMAVSVNNAGGSFAWSTLDYPLVGGTVGLTTSSTTSLTTTAGVSYTPTRTAAAILGGLHLSATGQRDLDFDSYTLGTPIVDGPLSPGVGYTATGEVQTGLEALPLLSNSTTVNTPALAPLGIATVTDTSPTNAEHQLGDPGLPQRRYQATTFDVSAAGDYAIAGINPTTTLWDDLLEVFPGTYDPASLGAVDDDFIEVGAPVRAALPATGLASDDAGEQDRNLVRVHLTPGRYSALVEDFDADRGSSAIYVQGPTGAAVIGGAPGAPDAPQVTGVVGGNSKAVVAVAPQGNTQGSPVTGATVYAVAAGHPTVTAAGTSPVTVTGLINGVTYTVYAASSNARGVGPASLTGLAVTPNAVVAGAPGISSAKAAATSATVTVTPPALVGTDAITGYKISLTSGKTTIVKTSATAGAITVTGLKPNTTYSVSVVATSAAGSSVATTARVKTVKPSVSLKLAKGKLTATIKASNKALGKVKVQLLAKAPGQRSFRTVQTKTTSSKGTVTFSTRPAAGTTYEVQLVISTYKQVGGKLTAH